jgi:RNA polymerase sigma-70 factor (ECF subfamily)
MKLEQKELKRIVDGCKAKNRSSQQKIYELLYNKMLPVCYRYARSTDEAKDMLQDGFIKVFEKIEQYSEGGSFEGWVRRIIVNTAIDTYRKNKKEIFIDDESRIKDDSDWKDIENESEYAGLSINDIVESMQNLSPAYRAVFNLFVMEGYTHQEIANDLEINIGTSKSNLAKAKANMKTMLIKKLNRL